MTSEKKWVESIAEESLQIRRDVGLPAVLRIHSGDPRITLVNEIKEQEADMIFFCTDKMEETHLRAAEKIDNA